MVETNPTARRIQRIQRRRWAMALICLVIFLSFLARSFFGERGILVGLQVKREYHRLVEREAQLKATNQELVREIQAIRDSDRAMEAIGRREFSFSRPGEVVYVFPGDEDGEPMTNEDTQAP